MRKLPNHFKKMAGAMLLLTVLVSACKKVKKQETSVPADETATPRALTLVWQDEFDGSSLNTSKWNYENETWA